VDSDDDLVEISSDSDVEVPRHVIVPLKKRKLGLAWDSKATGTIKQEVVKSKIKQEVGTPKIKQEVSKTNIQQEVIEIDDSYTNNNDTPIFVTREVKVDELRIATTPPKYWEVPRPGKSFATVLDVSRKPEGSYVNKKGEILSIAQIFRAYVRSFTHSGTFADTMVSRIKRHGLPSLAAPQIRRKQPRFSASDPTSSCVKPRSCNATVSTHATNSEKIYSLVNALRSILKHRRQSSTPSAISMSWSSRPWNTEWPSKFSSIIQQVLMYDHLQTGSITRSSPSNVNSFEEV
jgi:hypothetical protein